MSVHLDPRIILGDLAVANTCLMHFASLNSHTICSTLSTYLSSTHLVGSRLRRRSTLGREFISSFILDPRISNITGWYALLCFSFISVSPMIVNSLRRLDWLISDPWINDAAFLVFSSIYLTRMEIEDVRMKYKMGNRMKMRFLEPTSAALSSHWAIKESLILDLFSRHLA